MPNDAAISVVDRARAATRAPVAARAFVAVVIALLAVLLPAMAAGASLDRPATVGELARLEAALGDPSGAIGGPAHLCYVAFVDVAAVGAALDAAPDDGARREVLAAAVPMARFGVLAAIVLTTLFLHLTLVMVLSRALAWLACVALAALPPIREAGAMLRPEAPAGTFAMLGLLLLAGIGARRRFARRQSAWIGVPTALVLGAAVGASNGLAVATLPTYGVFLMVPAVCLFAVTIRAAVGWLRVVRRTRMGILPSPAFTRRVLPWAWASICGLAIAAAIVPADAVLPSRTGAGLFPAAPFWAFLVGGLAGLGGLLSLVRVISVPQARDGPELVVVVWAAVLLLHRVGLEDRFDALPAAPALAFLLALGFSVVAVLPRRLG